MFIMVLMEDMVASSQDTGEVGQEDFQEEILEQDVDVVVNGEQDDSDVNDSVVVNSSVVNGNEQNHTQHNVDLAVVAGSINQEEYSRDVSKLNKEQLKELLGYYKQLWGVGIVNRDNVTEFVQNMYGGCYSMTEINTRKATHLYKVVAMTTHMARLDYYDDNPDDRAEINKLYEIIFYTEQVHRSTIRLVMATEPSYDSRLNDDIGLSRFVPIDLSKLTAYQNLVIYIGDYIGSHGWCRYKDTHVFEKIYNGLGQFTYAWKEYNTLDKVIMGATTQHQNFDQWLNLTSNPNNGKYCAKYWSEAVDPRFMDLKKDRHVFSFRNAMYIALDKAEDFDITNSFGHRLYRFGDPNPPPINTVSAKYFDIDIDPETFEIVLGDSGIWEDISTPNFEHILVCQDLEPDVIRWAYILMGRVLYDVNEIDNWQIIPFFKGRAGTGKSTLMNTFSNVYEKIDVGTLSNNIEVKFGLSQIHGNFLYIAPEIKRDIKWDQAEFQSTVTGESVVVNRKNQDPIVENWKTPGMWAGNQLPGWNDNSGSLSRRFVIFEFLKKVMKGDTKLEEKLRKELPRLIIKCNMAYQQAVRDVGEDVIWDHLPQYFKDQAEALKIGTNCLKSLLMSDQIEKGPEFSVEEGLFAQAVNDHAAGRGFKRPTWEPDYYRTIFDEEGLVIEKTAGGRNKIIGVRIKNFEEPELDDETTSFA